MGEATKEDGPALEAATGDMSHDLPLSTSRGDSVSLEDCELQYNQFVEKNWSHESYHPRPGAHGIKRGIREG